MSERESLLCASGRHAWLGAEDRRRCCAGHVRVQDTVRQVLQEVGAENIVCRGGMWRDWLPAAREGVR